VKQNISKDLVMDMRKSLACLQLFSVVFQLLLKLVKLSNLRLQVTDCWLLIRIAGATAAVISQLLEFIFSRSCSERMN
jgi:hypothetical protein